MLPLPLHRRSDALPLHDLVDGTLVPLSDSGLVTCCLYLCTDPADFGWWDGTFVEGP